MCVCVCERQGWGEGRYRTQGRAGKKAKEKKMEIDTTSDTSKDSTPQLFSPRGENQTIDVKSREAVTGQRQSQTQPGRRVSSESQFSSFRQRATKKATVREEKERKTESPKRQGNREKKGKRTEAAKRARQLGKKVVMENAIPRERLVILCLGAVFLAPDRKREKKKEKGHKRVQAQGEKGNLGTV